jgi:SAM-dependent methyltransferase
MSGPGRRPRAAVGPAAGLFDLLSVYSDVPLSLKAFIVHRYWHASLSRLERLVRREGTVLDLGCGHGAFANFMGLRAPARAVLALEKNPRKAALARGRVSNVSVEDRDISSETFPAVDAVTLIDVLHHMGSFAEQEALLDTIARVLPAGGQFVLKEVSTALRLRFRITRALDRIAYPGEKFFFRHHDEFRHLLLARGFEVELVPFWEGIPYSEYVLLATKKS